MNLEEKYGRVIEQAKSLGVNNLKVQQKDNILYINGEAGNGEAKDKIWNTYGQIDPDFRSSDLVLNIQVDPNAPSTILRVSTQSSNLNIRRGPGLDQEVIGKAAHGAQVTLLSKYNSEWSLIKTDKGEEGYCSNQYLTSV